MASATSARGLSSGKLAGTVVLAVIGIVAVIAAVMYFTEPARSLPSVLGAITSPASRANAHRSLRGVVALVVGVIFLGAAALTGWRGRAASR